MIVIEHQADCGLGVFAGWLEAAGVGTLEVVRPYAGDAVPGAAPDGLLVLGGEMHASEDDRAPWLPEVRALLCRSVADGTPTLGICLGAQLLAVACGGQVVVGDPAGPERGAIEVRALEAAALDPLFAALSERFPATSAHRDGIRGLPEGSVLLAESDRYPQAFRLGPAAWGVQFHPEADPAIVESWVRAAEGAEREDLLAALAAVTGAWPAISAAGQQLATAFAHVVTARAAIH